MRIDKELLERAITLATNRGLEETDEATVQATKAFAENPHVNQAILGGMKHATSLKNLACTFGTLWQLGFEAGRVYRELESNLDKVDAAKV